MRNHRSMIYQIVLGLFALGTVANAQVDGSQETDSKTIKLMTYNLKFASPTFEPLLGSPARNASGSDSQV